MHQEQTNLKRHAWLRWCRLLSSLERYLLMLLILLKPIEVKWSHDCIIVEAMTWNSFLSNMIKCGRMIVQERGEIERERERERWLKERQQGKERLSKKNPGNLFIPKLLMPIPEAFS
jgi:hypothetical protein